MKQLVTNYNNHWYHLLLEIDEATQYELSIIESYMERVFIDIMEQGEYYRIFGDLVEKSILIKYHSENKELEMILDFEELELRTVAKFFDLSRNHRAMSAKKRELKGNPFCYATI